jgi:hypothetical protein
MLIERISINLDIWYEYPINVILTRKNLGFL